MTARTTTARAVAIASAIADAAGHVNGEGIRIDATELERILGMAFDAGLEAGKPVRKVRAIGSAAPFEPNTGDPRLDDFMRRSRAKNGAPKPRPAVKPPAFPYGLKRMTDKQRAEAVRFSAMAVEAWRRLGHEVIVERLEGQTVPAPAIDGRNVRVLPIGATA